MLGENLTVAALCKECDGGQSMELEQCCTTPDMMGGPLGSKQASASNLANRSFAGSKRSLAQSIASKENLLAMPWQDAAPSDPITTSIFDMFKIGPGPSSSHTIGPMKAAFDFMQDLRTLFGSDPLFRTRPAGDRFRMEIHLYGSLSATGQGHKTHTAIVGGLMGWLPATCDADTLSQVMSAPGQTYLVPILMSTDDASSVSSSSSLLKEITKEDSPSSTCASSPERIVDLGPTGGRVDIDSDEPTPSHFGVDGATTDELQRTWYPLAQLSVGAADFVWHDPDMQTAYPHPNTMVVQLWSNASGGQGSLVHEGEYYSVGGGFIMKKGCPPEDSRVAEPKYKYTTMTEMRRILAANPTLPWHELLMTNEMVLTGLERSQIESQLDNLVECMCRAVDRGLSTQGVLPGRLQLKRKAALLYEHARQHSLRADSFLQFINAYCYAASEENAAGRIVVTAPTSGASGVFPGLIYFMKHHLFYTPKQIREAVLVGGCIGFLVKRNASISGAEMGCMGEVGTASAMGAAMLAYAGGLEPGQVESAAEIAMEHHLGLTCDPIGGEVQVPCIQRNPFGAIKAYNAYLMSDSMDPTTNKISLDVVINTMRETGRDMSLKYKETSQGGLATNFTYC